MASAVLSDELNCSICLEVYKDPVSLPCEHNYCQVCIERVLDAQGSGGYTCPECRAEFQERPALQKNRKLSNIAERFHFTQQEHDWTGIFCTYCIHFRVPAAKSCLLCEAFLCEKHVKVHSKSAEHVLTEPTTSLEERKCTIHKKLLEYYCLTDAVCICVSCCVVGEHKGHEVKPMTEASEKKKEKLSNMQKKLNQKKMETNIKSLSLVMRKKKLKEKANALTEEVVGLFRDIRKQQNALEENIISEISRQEEKLSLQLNDLIQELEMKKDLLSRQILHIEKLCNMVDPLTVLQEPESDGVTFCNSEEQDKKDKERDKIQVVGVLDEDLVSKTLFTGLIGIVTNIKRKVNFEDGKSLLLNITEEEEHTEQTMTSSATDEAKDGYNSTIESSGIPTSMTIKDPIPDMESKETHCVQKADDALYPVSTKYYGKEARDVAFNINTAGHNVAVSSDNKVVSCSGTFQYHPERPTRFWINQVLTYKWFVSKHHYWDIEGSKSGCWRAGVAYASIERKQPQVCIGDNNKSWCLQKYYDSYSVKHDGKEIILSNSPACRRIRISLDYDAGHLSFYELSNPIKHLHTFTAKFTEPLHAAFWIWDAQVRIIS